VRELMTNPDLISYEVLSVELTQSRVI